MLFSGAPRWKADLPTSYGHHARLLKSRGQRLAFVLMVAALVVFPFVGTRYAINIANLIAIAMMGAIALNLLMGVAGQISIGNAAFMAIGGYVAAVAGVQYGLPFPLAIILAGVAGAAIGTVVGIPAARLRGIYLAVSTLALHFLVLFVGARYQADHVGPGGFLMPRIMPGPTGLETMRQWYFLLVPVAGLTFLISLNLLRTRFGRAWRPLAEHESVAAMFGVPLMAYKLLAFALTSFIIGVQGGLYGYYIGVVTDEFYTFHLAVAYIAMIVIGGWGTKAGPILGAVFVMGLPWVVKDGFSRLPDGFLGLRHHQLFDVEVLIYGLSIIVFILVSPGGLAALGRRIGQAWSTWPLSRRVDR